MTGWITLTNANPYRRDLIIRVRRDAITGYEQNAVMLYGHGNIPQGVEQRTFVYTTGGNQFLVGETLEQLDALILSPGARPEEGR